MDSSKLIKKKNSGYDQFGTSRKGPQDTTDEHCTIFYDKEKVWDYFGIIISGIIFYLTGWRTYWLTDFFFPFF